MLAGRHGNFSDRANGPLSKGFSVFDEQRHVVQTFTPMNISVLMYD